MNWLNDREASNGIGSEAIDLKSLRDLERSSIDLWVGRRDCLEVSSAQRNDCVQYIEEGGDFVSDPGILGEGFFVQLVE